MKRLLLVVLAAMFFGGCMSIILPTDRDMLHKNALNAQATSAQVQALQVVPSADGATVNVKVADWVAIKTWWAAEAKTWWAIDLWSQGKDPAKNPYVPMVFGGGQ